MILAAGFIIFRPQQPSRPPAPSAAPTTQPAPAPPPPPPPPKLVEEAALDRLLLTAAEFNAALGKTGISVDDNQTFNVLDDVDSNPEAPPECEPLAGVGEAGFYTGSRWTAVRRQNLAGAQQQQAVVLFPTAQDAAAFVSSAPQVWSACANRDYRHLNRSHDRWSVGPVSAVDGIVSAATTQIGVGFVCHRSLAASNNVVIDVRACSFTASDQAAIKITRQIAAKVPTT